MKKIFWLLFILILIPGMVFGEDLTPSPENSLLRFRLFRAGEMMPVDYQIYLLGDTYYLYKNDDLPIRFDTETADELVRIIDKYDARSWDGFEESDPYVDDGEFFDFSAALTDGTSIIARGDNAFPPDYFQVAGEMESLILSAEGDPIEEDICGTYVYESGGFGGDFTITISEDESYSYYEGPLSSYLGGGSWFFERGEIYLFEENGMDLVNLFAAGNGVLVFIETDSNNFPYVQIPDGGVFHKLKND